MNETKGWENCCKLKKIIAIWQVHIIYNVELGSLLGKITTKDVYEANPDYLV